MTKEEELDALKTNVLKWYKYYTDEIEKATINDLEDFNTRRRLIETFAESVNANAAYRKFISKYSMIKPPKNKE